MPDVARTLDLPSGQRFEYWKHILSHTFVPLEVSTPGGGDDFRGLLRGCELGSLRFIEVSAEAHTARDPHQMLVLVFPRDMLSLPESRPAA